MDQAVNESRSIFRLYGDASSKVHWDGKVTIEFQGRFAGDNDSSIKVKFVGHKKYLGYIVFPFIH